MSGTTIREYDFGTEFYVIKVILQRYCLENYYCILDSCSILANLNKYSKLKKKIEKGRLRATIFFSAKTYYGVTKIEQHIHKIYFFS